MARTNVRLSGFGGQGIILAGVILARAAVEHDRIFATQTQSYGAESRGGACTADVILSDERIDYPEPEELDVLVALSQAALDRHVKNLLPNGTLIVDADMVPTVPVGLQATVYRIAATQTAEAELGQRLVANIVMLGAVTRLTGLVTVDGLIATMESSLAPHLVEINRRAIKAGVSLAERLIS